ncbi:Holliday junction branch migration protein RuvA [Alkaliphilus serpentinus]|uniref:Holliday junction branch migration complex subunit RuvA n=1 Tax=Alkaliphilus serpentinus TaxID=1482731 RepID=A0A833M7J3_9FIRM|nr:Holliday junction branch migration protein RuvA [Alkaliphilus serpentinus]KAB3527682.1 Holliday junction branch migration protein RuvA [Alkaliphilus serpentinus]
MFEYIKGTVSEIIVDKIILEVNGMGYRINSSINSTSNTRVGDATTIFTHLAVKEDEISLYGFISRQELNMFKLLMTVSKIGPRVATAVLSTYTPEKLATYIRKNDVMAISKCPGVGKKTAERVVLELKDKVEDYGIDVNTGVTVIDDGNGDLQEATEALLSLGYNRLEAEKALKAVYKDGSNSGELIRRALGWLSK